jgi:hypothetical protein
MLRQAVQNWRLCHLGAISANRIQSLLIAHDEQDV